MKSILQKLIKFSNSWLGTIVIVLFVIFFIAQAFRIPSGSMKNTLLIGDNLFVKKFSYGTPIPHIPWIEVPVFPDFNNNGHLFEGERPKRGDIVVFRYPQNRSIHYVKRCVAVGGDIVFTRDKSLYLRPKEGDEYIMKNYEAKKIININGMLFVKDPYLDKFPGIQVDNKVTPDGTYPSELFNFGPIAVPDDEFFMLGDNRDHSNDSRFWGTVPYSHIVGKPWFIYFSWDDDYKIRWKRIGRNIDTLEVEK